MSLLCILIVATLAFGASVVGEREARKATSEGLAGLASTLADRLHRGIGQRASIIEVLAKIDSLKPTWMHDPEAARRVLQQSLVLVPNGSSLRFAGTDGVVRAAAGTGLEGEGVAAQKWFRHGLSGSAVEQAEALNYPLSGLDANGLPFPIVDIAAPVRDAEGNSVGVLSLSLTWIWAASLRQETLSRSSQWKTKELWILASDGRVIVGPDVGARPYSRAMLAEMIGSMQGSFSDRRGRAAILTGYAAFNLDPTLGWIVVARQPEAIAFLPARKVVWTILILGALTAALGLVASLVIAGRISHPITRLAHAADLIERHSIEMLPREHGSLEVVRLSSALRALIVRLGSAEERTAAAETHAADVASRFTHDMARLRNLADTDVLTQLPNRRRFLDIVGESMEMFRASGRPFGILMIDVDRFKSVNDRFGHSAGDRAIQWVGAKIAACVRPTDIAARFGGEEFIVLVPDVTQETAEALGERIRLAIAMEPMQTPSLSLPLTASIGVAMVEDSDSDVEALIARADLALYAAKAQGRNAVVTAASALVSVPERRVA